MYAVVTRSSSVNQVARVSNEVKVQARKFAAPQSMPSIDSQQSTVAGASGVQSTRPPASHYADASSYKASQVSTVIETDINNQANQQRFSRPQQHKINRFNLEMVNETPKNTSSSAHAQFANQGATVFQGNKFMEIPYMIAMVNPNLANMKPASEDDDIVEDEDEAEAEAEENTQGTMQRTSKII